MNPLMFAPHGTALSVNVNKVALLRNTRYLGVPSVIRAAELCLQAGAQGITVHPRPDERHIRASDVRDLAQLMRAWPGAEFNLEGNPFHNLVELVREVRPQQATLVPDAEDQFTSDHGWRFPQDHARLQAVVAQIKAMGVRVSLFMDPDPQAMPAAKATGADRVELYTETYASAHGKPEGAAVLQRFVDTAHAAQAAGLGVNAGHDLNLANLTEFLRAVPGVVEVSIGHALVADALELGYAATIAAYRRCIDLAQHRA
jgi:pyridoxine 5-phosphate synthase